MLLNFYDFKPIIVNKLFLDTKGVTSLKYLRNVFQSLLIFR